MQEIRYCYDSIFGLTITNYDCGNTKNIGSLDFLNPTFDGVLEDAGGEQTIGGGSTPFSIPINYSLTGYNSSLAKPMIWARVENSSIIPKSSGPYTSRFLVTPYGRSGFNVENPRATLDIKSLASYDIPALIVGRQALGTSNRTQHFQYVPLLTENGYNQITKKNDQGFFYTDGKGTNGANLDGSFIIAPWANGSSNDCGGLRLDSKGNLFVHGSIYATKIKVQLKWWSDYVFDKDYCLMPLCELENYIKLNKHLPAFKTEHELIETGLELAETISLQQKQIEELTLYIIELEKRIKNIEISNR
jgi:hypothetical protein